MGGEGTKRPFLPWVKLTVMGIKLEDGGPFLIQLESLGFSFLNWSHGLEISCLFVLQREFRSIFEGRRPRDQNSKGQVRSKEHFPLKKEKCSCSVWLPHCNHLWRPLCTCNFEQLLQPQKARVINTKHESENEWRSLLAFWETNVSEKKTSKTIHKGQKPDQTQEPTQNLQQIINHVR